MTPTAPLLFEVGCEEIPARFLSQAQKVLGENVKVLLEESRLLPESQESIETFSTPRRLIVRVPAVLARQHDKVEEILGPPAKVAYDANGNLTRAAESFASKNQARLESLSRLTTPKGEYLALKRTTRGSPAEDLLPQILPAALSRLSFPKSMYWEAKAGPRFVRPIRWLLAVLGEGEGARTIRFEYAGVRSGNFTFGHRLRGKGKIPVTGFDDYAAKLREACVEFDPQARRRTIQNSCKVLLEDSLRIIEDKELEEWIVNSTECPSAILGKFDQRFLNLSREILITVMRDHQRYFAVENLQGQLEPHFVAFLNVDSDEKGLIRRGHERVLTARFSDAEFFWEMDQRLSLLDRRGLLTKVTYQAELGNYQEKVQRMKVIAANVCALLEEKGLIEYPVTPHVLRATDLSKCDLTTQMVQEFPELQGIVGGLYAFRQGELSQIAEGIYDHYLPQAADGKSPRSIVGALVSLADKLDSVVAGFAVGHQPTSSGDPFGLRRHGNGIIKVLLEFNLPIDLRNLVMDYHRRIEVGGGFGIQTSASWSRVSLEVPQFFNERLRYYLESVRKLRFDNVRAVISAAPKLEGVPAIAPLDALRRVEALEGLRGSEDLEALCVAAKRIKNILSKSATANDWQAGSVDEALLGEEQEQHLYREYLTVAAKAEEHRSAGQYREALEAIAGLRPTVDRFFDKVLVMAENPALRQNRLRLLGKLDELFSGIAQFAEIVVAPANVGAST